MKIQISDAENLARSALQKFGYSPDNADIISRHIIDSELRGYGAAGLARVLNIGDRLGGKQPAESVEITRSTVATAQIDGHDTLGYIVAHQATEEAIQKAKQTGVGIVGVNNTWMTGMLAYYAEIAAKQDLVTIIVSNATAWVAPHGGYKPMFGPNPLAIGIPSSTTPVIYDIATSKVLHADLILAQRLNKDIQPDVAYNDAGEMTQNPWDALKGAIAVWGGHKGSGLAAMIQLLGVMAGSTAFPPNISGVGFVVIAIDPVAFRPLDDFKAEVDDYSKKMKESPPLPGNPALRMPFERSASVRDETLRRGEFEVEERVVEALRAL